MSASSNSSVKVLYTERQWVPWFWWVLGALFVVLMTAQVRLTGIGNWMWVAAVFVAVITFGALYALSSTRISVEEEDGIRWLTDGKSALPHTAVSRSLAVPATAKRNALGHQLDPAAYVVSHGWVPEMAMMVIDDPEDETPYWLICSRNPDKLLRAFVGETHTGS
ncbi:MAG: DUF3093 domain-containing protein [Corynebacterium sp.]|nr:DUF3093 domain-containing protein [Corynebacterium sp.]